MPRRSSCLALLVASASLLASCGHDTASPKGGGATATPASGGSADGTGRTAARADPIRLRRLPRATVARCRSLQAERTIPVLCPVELPGAGWKVRYRSLVQAKDRYLCDLRRRPRGRDRIDHVLAGGVRGELSFATRDGRWPADPSSRDPLLLVGTHVVEGTRRERPVPLEVVGPAEVGGEPALVLRAAGFPDGGVHGGHLVVIWNQARIGRVLSIHFHGDDASREAVRKDALLEAADAMSRAG